MKKPRVSMITTIGAGMLFLSVGFYALYKYDLTPGKTYKTLGSWPKTSTLKISVEKPSLIVFLHPQCSCSRATVAELKELLGELKNRVQIKVVFIKPQTRDIAWLKDDLWDEVSNLEGVELVTDEGGREAALFGASTSGQSYLFDRGPRLIFQGGLTPSRGHRGPSSGNAFIRDWLANKKLTHLISDVFGCEL